MKTAFWMQAGGCGGDSMSFLSQSFACTSNLFQALDIDLLWHPSFSCIAMQDQKRLLEDLAAGKIPLDIFILEGSVICGPSGTGLFDTHMGRPRKDLVQQLTMQADTVIAAGTCASFGGFGADGEAGSTGLQFHKTRPGGLLGPDFRSGSGQPVINLAGCPCHHDVMAGALAAAARGTAMDLDEYHRPREWYGTMIHQGCTRNEYHEYRVEESDFGELGCLFFHMGCAGPLVPGPCNKLLWNQQSSKPRAGVPCFGCTDPEFPGKTPFFYTQNIEGIPLSLPNGVNRAHYMVYKSMAAAAAPLRLKKRTARV